MLLLYFNNQGWETFFITDNFKRDVKDSPDDKIRSVY